MTRVGVSKIMRFGLVTLTVAAGFRVFGWTQEPARSWLDEPRPASWNAPDAAVPSAPDVQSHGNPVCRDTSRPMERGEDRRVRERGWDLVGAYQGGWRVLVVRGAAGYDGMCRPRQYQDFVFVDGSFAGTLAPQAMDSRTDGALSRVFLRSDTELIAEYYRYGTADPLCCPSRTTSVVFEIAGDPPTLRPVSSSSSQASWIP